MTIRLAIFFSRIVRQAKRAMSPGRALNAKMRARLPSVVTAQALGIVCLIRSVRQVNAVNFVTPPMHYMKSVRVI
jgi:hypothetical protein